MPRSSITRKLAQSVRLQRWSGPSGVALEGGAELLVGLRNDLDLRVIDEPLHQFCGRSSQLGSRDL